MGPTDARIDTYIAKSADFAKPILSHLRSLVHEACPDVQETIKWGFPHFDYHGVMCSMAAFKQHATFGFWKGTLIVGKNTKSLDAMGSFGRLTSVSDLPPKKELIVYIKRAMKLNEQGVKAPVKHVRPKKPIRMPAEFKTALGKNKKAKAVFDAFSPSHKREYLEWIIEAKGEETRKRRIATALEWISKGKSRNWKYMK